MPQTPKGWNASATCCGFGRNSAPSTADFWKIFPWFFHATHQSGRLWANLPCQLNFGQWNFREEIKLSTSFGVWVAYEDLQKTAWMEKKKSIGELYGHDKSEKWVKTNPSEGMNEPQRKSKMLLIHFFIYRGLVGNDDKARSKLGSCFTMSWPKCLNIWTKW